MKQDFLSAMAHSSRARVARARELCPEATLRQQALMAPPAPRLSCSEQGFDLIAEVKLRSPARDRRGAERPLAAADEIGARVRAYASAGAAAVSVLTEPHGFDGALSHLECAAQALGDRIPAMRKDFLVDRYQVYEARAAGAGGVLLILRMLTHEQQALLIEASAELSLFVLLEAFDVSDLERAAELVERYRRQAELLIGVNCRDLGTLQIEPERLEALAPSLPPDVLRVAESGIESPADAARVAAAGYEMALVGGALMQSERPAELAAALLAAGRAATRSPVP